jgi:uroporphyrinogen decarboxylase
MKIMNSRERVLAAIAHKEADRVPVDFGGSLATSLHTQGYAKLKEYLNMNLDKEIKVARGRAQLAAIDYDLQDTLGVDCRMLLVKAPDGWINSDDHSDILVDEFGMEWKKYEDIGSYETVSSPLFGPEVTVETVKNMKWPDPGDTSFLLGAREKAEQIRKNTDKAIIANLALQINTQSNKLRGFEDYLADMIGNPALIESIMDRVTELYIERAKAILKEVGDFVDIVYVGDDLGTQIGPMFSLNTYRKLLKPRQKKLFEVIKSAADVKIFYHSCGACSVFIDDLAEIGIDILNPVQVSAAGMDTKELKKKYGDKVCFWGAVDTQRVLPFGTVAEVRDEVKRRIEDLAPGGGYVCASVHNLRPEVPPENILAMIKAAKEYGVY